MEISSSYKFFFYIQVRGEGEAKEWSVLFLSLETFWRTSIEMYTSFKLIKCTFTLNTVLKENKTPSKIFCLSFLMCLVHTFIKLLQTSQNSQKCYFSCLTSLWLFHQFALKFAVIICYTVNAASVPVCITDFYSVLLS